MCFYGRNLIPGLEVPTCVLNNENILDVTKHYNPAK